MRYPFGRMLAAWAITAVSGIFLAYWSLRLFYGADFSGQTALASAPGMLGLVCIVLLATLPCFALLWLASGWLRHRDKPTRKILLTVLGTVLRALTVLCLIFAGAFADDGEPSTPAQQMPDVAVQFLLPLLVPLVCCIWLFDFNDKEVQKFDFE